MMLRLYFRLSAAPAFYVFADLPKFEHHSRPREPRLSGTAREAKV